MTAVLSILFLGILLCVAAGVAVRGLLTPAGRWTGLETLPMGLCTLMALAYPIGFAVRATVTAPIVVLVLIAGLGGAVVRRARARRTAGDEGLGLAAALRPELPDAVVGAAGVLLGILLLIPTLRQGFPTTIAATNNDGWGYAGMVDWLKEHPFPRAVQPDIAEPMTLVPWNQDINHFAIGFEHVAALLASLLGRDGYEVVNATSALGIVVAVTGWAMLLRRLRGGLDVTAGLLTTVAVTSPLVLLPFVENYVTQFVSICIWPFALAAFIAAMDRPAAATFAVAGLASAGLIGTYPAMVPWLVPPLIAAAVVVGGGGWADTRWASRISGRVPGAVAGLLCLTVATAILAPIQFVRAIRNLLFLDSVYVGALADFFTNDAYTALAFGATSPLALFPRGPLGWPVTAAVILLAGVYALALAPAWRRGRRRWAVLALAGGLLLTTLAVVVQYRVRGEYPYQVYKGLISGGALLAGVAVIGLLMPSTERARTPRIVALGLLAALWIPSSASLLQASSENTTGFRAAEVQLDRELERLPEGTTLLVEGAAPDARSFQLRMMAAYFAGQDDDLAVEGLGSTGSYLTPGGLPEWRPDEPWTEVLSTGPQPVTTPREQLWTNGAYTLARAPGPDASTYGLGWYPPEPAEGGVLVWTSAPAEILVSNPDDRPARVRLGLTVGSYAVPRTLTLVAGPQRLTRRLPADAPERVTMPLEIPAEDVLSVQIAATPGPLAAPPGDARTLQLRVQGIRVDPVVAADG